MGNDPRSVEGAEPRGRGRTEMDDTPTAQIGQSEVPTRVQELAGRGASPQDTALTRKTRTVAPANGARRGASGC